MAPRPVASMAACPSLVALACAAQSSAIHAPALLPPLMLMLVMDGQGRAPGPRVLHQGLVRLPGQASAPAHRQGQPTSKGTSLPPHPPTHPGQA